MIPLLGEMSAKQTKGCPNSENFAPAAKCPNSENFAPAALSVCGEAEASLFHCTLVFEILHFVQKDSALFCYVCFFGTV